MMLFTWHRITNTISTCAFLVALVASFVFCLATQQQQQHHIFHLKSGAYLLKAANSRSARRPPCSPGNNCPTEVRDSEQAAPIDLSDLLPDCARTGAAWMRAACRRSSTTPVPAPLGWSFEPTSEERLLEQLFYARLAEIRRAKTNRMLQNHRNDATLTDISKDSSLTDKLYSTFDDANHVMEQKRGTKTKSLLSPASVAAVFSSNSGSYVVVPHLLQQLSHVGHPDMLHSAKLQQSGANSTAPPRKKSNQLELVQQDQQASVSTAVTNSSGASVGVELSNGQQQLPIVYAAGEPKFPLECVVKAMTFWARKSDNNGSLCKGKIRMNICYGSCETGEIADWLFPYKKSYHKVCSHGSRIKRRVQLTDCQGPLGAEPNFREFEYVDATTCVCQKCNSRDTTCLANMGRPPAIDNLGRLPVLAAPNGGGAGATNGLD